MVAGVAGLVAGALSMAAGEYISVRSQSEQALEEIDVERREIAADESSFCRARMNLTRLLRGAARIFIERPIGVARGLRVRGSQT